MEPAAPRTVRVRTELLDELIDSVGEILLSRARLRTLATRIDDATPVVVLTASCGIEPARVVAYKPLLDAGRKSAAKEGLFRHMIVQPFLR